MPKQDDDLEEERIPTEPGAPERIPLPEREPETSETTSEAPLWYGSDERDLPDEPRAPFDWKGPLAFLVVVGALFVAGGGAWWWVDGRFPRGAIEIAIPISSDAVVMGIAGVEHDTLVRWDREASRRWVLPVGQVEPWTPSGGASVAGGILTLRTRVGDTYETVGIDVESGAVLWKGLGRKAPDAPLPRWLTHLADESALFELTESVPPEVIAVDRKTGAELWKTRLDRVPMRAWLRDNWIGFDSGEGFQALSRADGSTVEAFAATGLCVAGDEVVATLADGSLRRGAPGAPTTSAGPEVPLVGLCGTYKGLLVAAIENLKPEPPPDAPVEERKRWASLPSGGRLVAFDGAQVVWSTGLATMSFAVPDQDARLAYPDAVSFAGELPRFLPVMLVDHSNSEKDFAVALHMVDLDTGEVAWRTHPYVSLGQYPLMRYRDRNLLLGHTTVASLDAATGELIGATRSLADGNLQPWHLVDGALWLGGTGSLRAIDPQTLAPLPGSWGDLTTEDARSDMESVLARVK